jgi:hypothetical protein
MRLTKKSKKILGGAAIVGLVGSGAAYAYWTTTGSGSATATTAAGLPALTTTQNGTVTAMAPGGAVQDVNFTINNSAATNQYATTVAMTFVNATYVGVGASSAVGTTWLNHPAGGPAPGCTVADFTLTQPVAGVDVPPAGLAFTQITTPQKSGRIAMNNRVTNQDDCKGTTIALAFTIS